MLIALCMPITAGCATARKMAATEPAAPTFTPSPAPPDVQTAVEKNGPDDIVPVSHETDEIVQDLEATEWTEAPPSHNLSLDDLQAMALEHNPAIRQAMFAASKAAGVRTQVGLKPNPEIGYSGQQIGDEGAAGQNGAYIEQTFVSADKLNWNRAVLDRDVQSLMWEAEAQRYRVQTDVELKFYDALLAQRRLSLAQDFREVAQKGVEIAEKRREALEGAKPDVLQAEIQLTEVDLIIRQAELEFEAAWNSLVAIVGLPHLPPCGLAGDLKVAPDGYDLELVYCELIAASPQLQAARARVDRARTNIGRQSIQAIPNLTAQLGAGHDDATNDAYVNVQLGLPVPIHNKNQGNQQAAQAELCRALQEVQRLELATRAQLQQVMRDYRVSRVTIERYEGTILPKAKETLELSEQAYAVGEFDFLRVLTVRRAFFETNLKYVESLANAAKAAARIDGMLLTGGLNDVPDFDGDDGLRGQALDGK